MRRVGKIAFYLGIAACWLFLALVCLEFWQIYRWKQIPLNNPIAEARSNESLWPLPKPQDRPEQSAGRPLLNLPYDWEAAVIAAPTYPPFPEQRIWQNRADFFMPLDEKERLNFAFCYQLCAAVINAAGEIAEQYPALALKTSDFPAQEILLRHHQRIFQKAESDAYLEQAEGEKISCTTLRPWKPSPSQEEHALLFLKQYEASHYNDPNYLWRKPFFSYKPHISGRGEKFHTNNFGFRDDDLPFPKGEKTFRILCIGGSTTEEGDSNATTYPNLLENKLQRYFDSNKISVVNCGISGMNTFKERYRLPDYAALEADVVIIYNAINDICHEFLPRWEQEMRPWQKLLRRSQFLTYYANRLLLPGQDTQRAAIEGESMQNLKKMRTYFQERGAEVFFCTFAAPPINKLSKADRDYFDYFNSLEWGGRYYTFATYCALLEQFNKAIENLCAETGAPCIPVAEGIQGGSIYFGDNCHMKNVGIELKADIVLCHLIPYIEGHWTP